MWALEAKVTEESLQGRRDARSDFSGEHAHEPADGRGGLDLHFAFFSHGLDQILGVGHVENRLVRELGVLLKFFDEGAVVFFRQGPHLHLGHRSSGDLIMRVELGFAGVVDVAPLVKAVWRRLVRNVHLLHEVEGAVLATVVADVARGQHLENPLDGRRHHFCSRLTHVALCAGRDGKRK